MSGTTAPTSAAVSKQSELVVLLAGNAVSKQSELVVLCSPLGLTKQIEFVVLQDISSPGNPAPPIVKTPALMTINCCM